MEWRSDQLKSFLNHEKRKRVFVDGRPMPKREAAAFLYAVSLQLAMADDQLRQLGVRSPVRRQRLPAFYNAVESDAGHFMSALKKSVLALRQDDVTPLTLFRILSRYDLLVLVMLAIPHDSLLQPLGTTARVALHRIFNYLNRFPCSVSVSEEREVVKWLYYDSLNCSTPLGEKYNPLAAKVRDKIHHWFSSYVPTLRTAGFSNGSTADSGPSFFRKLDYAIPDEVYRVLTRYPMEYSVYCILEGSKSYCSKSPCSLQFVPKSFTALRSICMEPAYMNLCQQFLYKDLELLLRSKSYFAHHCAMFDQERSRRLCRLGSYNGSFATIDMTAASDTITVSLVRYLFSGCPILDLLLALRSEITILPSGERYRHCKFAAMGSVLCFVVMEIINVAACDVACELAGIRESDQVFEVVGDDIVIPSEAYSAALETLRSLGYVINYDKSYRDGAFREACGEFSFQGESATAPLYPRGRTLVPFYCKREQILTRIDLANDAFLYYGNGNLRRLLIQPLLEFLGGRQNFVMYGEERSAEDLLSYSPDTAHCRYRLTRPTFNGRVCWPPTVRSRAAYTVVPRYSPNGVCTERERLDLWLFLATVTVRSRLLPLVELPLSVPVGTRPLGMSVRFFWK